MPAYAALDVSKKSTSIHVVDATGTCLWRGKSLTEPEALAEALAPFASDLVKVGLETCCWSTWLCHALRERGLPAVCMDARQAHAALSVTMNKTDANDARGLAHLLRVDLYREVRLKSWDDVRMRTLIHARRAILRAQIDIANALRGAARGPLVWRWQQVRGTAARGPSIAACASTSQIAPTSCRSRCPCWRRGRPCGPRSSSMIGRSARRFGPTLAAAC